MKFLAAVAGISLILLTLACTSSTPKLEKAPALDLLNTEAAVRWVPGEVIVKRKPGLARKIRALHFGIMSAEPEQRTTSGGEIIYKISISGVDVFSSIKGSDTGAADPTLAAVDALRKSPDVLYAQPNYVYDTLATVPNDPRYSQQWHYRTNGSANDQSLGGISLPGVWDHNKGSASVIVGVIDTGILPQHPDIVGSPNLVAGYDLISDPAVANDGDGRDSDPTDPGDGIAAGACGFGQPPQARPNSWHGTHVAGTIGVGNTNNSLGVAGINWNVKVEPIRVLGKCGGSTDDIADAIRWAAGLRVPGVPDNPNKVRVINMSLGGKNVCTNDNVMQSAINDAFAAGVTVVVAAGNSRQDASLFTPAGCNNVIAVAASDTRGYLATRYSNFGASVKIMAPGGDITRDDDNDGNPDGVLSLVSPDAGTYAFYNGTSMAAPHVAGVSALLLACHPNFSPLDIQNQLQSSAIKRSSAECPNACGAGLLNATVASCESMPK